MPKAWSKASAAAMGNSQPRDGPAQRPRGRIRRNCDWVTASNGQTTRMSPAAERSSLQEDNPDSEMKFPANHHFKLAKVEIKGPLTTRAFCRKIAENAAIDTLTPGVSKANFVQPKTFGCTTGTQFFSTNSAPNYASDVGDNHYTHIPGKVVFIAVNLPNPLITFFPAPAVD